MINNNSHLFANKIQKSHENGITITCTAEGESAENIVQKNFIEACTKHGIVVEGSGTNPRIESNYIESNRKSGIKLDYEGKAHIGGQEFRNELPNVGVKQDGDGVLVGDPIKFTEEYETLYQNLFEDCIG